MNCNWIGLGKESKTSILLRKEFCIAKEPVFAKITVCGLGWYTMKVNGASLTDNSIAPIETNFKERVLLDRYDVTQFIKKGPNVLLMEIGNGRYETYEKYRAWQLMYYGIKRGYAHLLIGFEDGSAVVVDTDESWKVHEGNVLTNCLFDGMTMDKRINFDAAELPGYNDGKWESAKAVAPPAEKYELSSFGIRVTCRVDAIRHYKTEDGIIFDFGENLPGWVELVVESESENKVVVNHAEFVNPDGTLNPLSNNRALSEDVYYIPKGRHLLAPKFTYHGFQYAKVKTDKELTIVKATLCCMHADIKRTGGFQCSDEAMNRLHEVILRTQLGGLMSFPMDCPQRDERQGWIGDGYVTVKTCTYNFGMKSFYKKWLEDIRLNQEKETGEIPVICPYQLMESTPEWCCGYSILAFDLMNYYDDIGFIQKNYDAFCAYADFMISKMEDFEYKDLRYGDWCSNLDGWKSGEPYYTATLFVYFHLRNIIRAAEKLGVRCKYVSFCDQLKKNLYLKLYHKGSGIFGDGSQFSCAMAILLKIVEKQEADRLLEHMIDDIETSGYRLTGGILGVKYTIEVLMMYDRPDILWKALHRKDYPGYLHMIEGKNTLPEFWEGLGTEKHELYGSGNHCMFGSIDAFFYEALAGIRAYGEVEIRPYIPKDLNYVSAYADTKIGTLYVDWRRDKNRIYIDILKPCEWNGRLVIRKEYVKNAYRVTGLVKECEDDKFLYFRMSDNGLCHMECD